MIDIRRSDAKYKRDAGWLKSSASFSFGEYDDPSNRFFGPLCVFNDDKVAGRHGFGAHPHREMEIVTVVLKGQLKHADSAGHTAVTAFGGVQRMSAGTGIIHSEVNPGDEETELLQIWFVPDTKRLSPSYETARFDPAAAHNRLLPIVSNRPAANVAHIHQDLTMYYADLDAGAAVSYTLAPGRLAFLFIIEGEVSLNGEHALGRRDEARISDTAELELRCGGDGGAQLLLIDLPPSANREEPAAISAPVAGPRSKLLVRLVTGQLLIDTDERNYPFSVEPSGDGWLVTIEGIRDADAARLAIHLNELNLFYFEYAQDGGSLQKYWLYDKDEPGFVYDRDNRRASITLDSRVAYSNDKV